MVQLSIPSLLVALPSMTDPHFSRSVLLLVQHTRDGAMGFVINRPLPMSLRDPSFQNRYRIPQDVPLWMGGPVSTENGVVLHNEGRDVSATFSFDKLRISVSDEAITGLLESADEEAQMEGSRRAHQPYRFIIGQASWAPKQLDAELKSGLWIQKPMDEKLVFSTPWQEIWPRAFDDLGIHPLDIKASAQSYLN